MQVVASTSTIGGALELAESLRPDIVVLDVDLAGVCSVDFIPAAVGQWLSRGR